MTYGHGHNYYVISTNSANVFEACTKGFGEVTILHQECGLVAQTIMHIQCTGNSNVLKQLVTELAKPNIPVEIVANAQSS